MNKTLLITGATGFIGQGTVKFFSGEGYDIIAYVRDKSTARKQLGSKVSLITDFGAIANDQNIHAIINLAGEPIAGGLWTEKRRQILLNSRIETTDALVALVERLHNKPDVMISASAVGYYGRCGSEEVIESTSPQNIFMSRLCQQWETSAQQVENHGVRLVIPRISVILGSDGGALAQLALPIKFGLGARFGRGDHYFPWMHKADLISFFNHAITNTELCGPYNMTTQDRCTQHQFNKTLAKVLKRPYFMWVPKAPIKILLGELSDLFISGQNLSYAKLYKTGFTPRFEGLEDALKDIF